MSTYQYNQEALKNLQIEDTSVLDRLVDSESAREAHLKKDHAKVDKRMTLTEAIANYVADGDCMTDSGFAYVRTPHQAFWEIMRQGRRTSSASQRPTPTTASSSSTTTATTPTTPTWAWRCGASTGTTTACSGRAG